MCHSLYGTKLIGIYRSLAVDGLSECVYYTTLHGITYGHGHNSSRGLYHVTLCYTGCISEQNGTDIVLLKVQDHSVNLARELQQLSLHRLFQTVDTGDTIRNLNYGSDVCNLKLRAVFFDLFLDH